MWTIYKNNKEIKTYPFKLQCIIWLYLHKWVFSGTAEWTGQEVVFICDPQDPEAVIEIKESKNVK